jgi:hypothetical protein
MLGDVLRVLEVFAAILTTVLISRHVILRARPVIRREAAPVQPILVQQWSVKIGLTMIAPVIAGRSLIA